MNTSEAADIDGHKERRLRVTYARDLDQACLAEGRP